MNPRHCWTKQRKWDR